MDKKTKFENLIIVVSLLVNEFSEDERKLILELNYNDLKGLHRKQLTQKISELVKDFVPGGTSGHPNRSLF